MSAYPDLAVNKRDLKMLNLLISYSHKDEILKNELEKQLASLKRQGFIKTWHDRRIAAGENFDLVIQENIRKANIILLLVSADFLASDYCYEREMQYALHRHNRGLTTVMPVILRPCDWKESPIGKLLACPTDGKPITEWHNIDAAFLDVVTSVKMVIARDRRRIAAQ